VPLTELGYEGGEGLHLMMPASTAVFDTGGRGASFVHGGNSLQERLVPVLTVVHRAAAGADTLGYTLEAEPQEGVAGMLCLRGQVTQSTHGQLSFGGARAIELGLRAVPEDAATVELCQARFGARIEGGALMATVGEPFELFFKLSGPHEGRVRVELHHPGAAADVRPTSPEARFPVTAAPRPGRAPAAARAGDPGWLEAIDPAVRPLFAHLEAHGSATEDEAVELLGSPRALRRFAVQLDALAARAPFTIRIDQNAGVKRYVREGGPR
jgi:hypothetical protein